MAGMSVADVPVVTRNDDLLDGNLIRRWLAWGFVWLLVFPTVGAVVAAGQRLARQCCRLPAGLGAIGHQPARPPAPGDSVLQPSADCVAGGNPKCDSR